MITVRAGFSGEICYQCQAPTPPPPPPNVTTTRTTTTTTTTATTLVCRDDQYASGGACTDQPKCGGDTPILYGATPTQQGFCGESCKLGGTEYYAVIDLKRGRGRCEPCLACKNDRDPECDSSECSWGFYRTGTCGMSATKRTLADRVSNGYQCESHPTCKEGVEYLDTPNWARQRGTCQPFPGDCGTDEYFRLEKETIAKCLPQPTCKPTQYLANATATTPGRCEAQAACEDDEHLAGAGPRTKGLCVSCEAGQYYSLENKACTACADSSCADDEYSSGTCGGTTSGECLPQPTCEAGSFLEVAAGQRGKSEGSCKPCSNAQCKATVEYRAGVCEGEPLIFGAAAPGCLPPAPPGVPSCLACCPAVRSCRPCL